MLQPRQAVSNCSGDIKANVCAGSQKQIKENVTRLVSHCENAKKAHKAQPSSGTARKDL